MLVPNGVRYRGVPLYTNWCGKILLNGKYLYRVSIPSVYTFRANQFTEVFPQRKLLRKVLCYLLVSYCAHKISVMLPVSLILRFPMRNGLMNLVKFLGPITKCGKNQ